MYRKADPHLLEQCAEEAVDIISAPFQDELRQTTRRPCPRCGSDTRAEVNTAKVLRTASTRLSFLARCTGCGCLFDPDLGIIVELGNLGRLEPAIPLIHHEESES